MPTPKKIALTAALLACAASLASAQQPQVGLFANTDDPWSTAEDFSFERAMKVARLFGDSGNTESRAVPAPLFATESNAPGIPVWEPPVLATPSFTMQDLPGDPTLLRHIVWGDSGPTILDPSPSEGSMQQPPEFGAADLKRLYQLPTLDEQAEDMRWTTPVLITDEATTLDVALSGFPLPSPPIYVPQPRPISFWPEPSEPRWTGWSEGGFAGVECRVLGSTERSGLFINVQAGVKGPLGQPLMTTGISIGWSFRQDRWEDVLKL